MTDQLLNKPALTPEEELDVLEAVWKIGQEKGMMLLNPLQLKRLVDAGRVVIAEADGVEEFSSTKQDEQNISKLYTGTKVTRQQAQLLVSGLRVRVKHELNALLGGGGWGDMSGVQVQYAISAYFEKVYGMSEDQMVDVIIGSGD